MAFISTEHAAPSLSPLGAVRAGVAGFIDAFNTYRRRRAVYLRTLRELQSYRPHELHDLRVQPGDFEELARKHAGL